MSGMRCRALDKKGKQCRGLAVGEYSFHGDSELDSYSVVGWVLVPFCNKHVGALGEKEMHRQTMARHRKERKSALKRPKPKLPHCTGCQRAGLSTHQCGTVEHP